MSIIQGTAHTSAGGYQIQRSLRFNSADSAYLNRTPASAGNRRTMTYSFWYKRSTLGTSQQIISAGSAISDQIFVGDTNIIRIYLSGAYRIETTPVYRDPSSWYHIVIAIDTTQATGSNRVRLYVNGSEVTAYSGTTISQNTDIKLNDATTHYIGRYAASASEYLNGYLTEINFIDGQALTPSSFGETDSATGVWKPKAYSGTYGTNGFYLNFSDNSNTTAATLGKDSSGNGNNWTPNNFSVTAGAGNDSLVDTPTSYGTDTGVGGEVRGNYATWNPLDKDDGITSVTNGNLNVVTNGSNGSIKSTIAFPSGKWYWEVTSDAVNSGGTQAIGIIPQSQPPTNNMSDSGKLGYALDVSNSDRKFENGTATSYGTYTQANGAIYMLAFDQDAGKLWYGINGTWLASGAPASGTNPSSSSIPTTTAYCAAVSDNTVSGTFTVNFGQRAFAYTAPSGFKALCTQNLPTPTIGATSTTQANRYFDINTRTGTGSAGSVTGKAFAPDFVWTKSRSAAQDHELYDVLRGTTKYLLSDTTTAEGTAAQGLTSFNSDGFSFGTSVGSAINISGQSIVDWFWKANGAGSSNTSGTITSTVSANTTAGFSIVTYTGNNTSGTVGHGLGVKPSFFIIKKRTNSGVAYGWYCYHTTLGATKHLVLNTTAGESSSSFLFNDTEPTSSVFSVGSSDATNDGSIDYVAYCFAAVAGYSAFGSYTGNGSTDGPFVYTGFRPRFVLVKQSSSTTNWFIVDSARDTYNVVGLGLNPNTSSTESSGDTFMDMTSNGFKIRQSTGAMNTSSGTYIYAAFAESPFKYSLAR